MYRLSESLKSDKWKVKAQDLQALINKYGGQTSRRRETLVETVWGTRAKVLEMVRREIRRSHAMNLKTEKKIKSPEREREANKPAPAVNLKSTIRKRVNGDISQGEVRRKKREAPANNSSAEDSETMNMPRKGNGGTKKGYARRKGHLPHLDSEDYEEDEDEDDDNKAAEFTSRGKTLARVDSSSAEDELANEECDFSFTTMLGNGAGKKQPARVDSDSDSDEFECGV
ncbi:hypothetical protein B0H13DRAFT_1881104 [Mycena leptocephala]|nr:hypothetical protein B0H13DRAFT_1881104 [Mycena leptocephala]